MERAARGSMALRRCWARSRPSVPLRGWFPRLAELDQHAAHALRVEEGDERAVGALARLLVDELDARRAAAVERVLHVLDLEAHVVQSGPAALEESGDRVVRPSRFQQLEGDGANV